ncbi:MAG: response regulator transcription factor [Anaerolineales bacterium]|nr:response regulator transcription factor [Anaerolineales bacterium]
MSETILLVDDDESLRQVMSQYLAQEGYRVIAAGSGAEALKLFYSERPGAVLLDLMMPGMDGWEVCARLRELSDAPILLVSARTSQEDKLRGFRLGIDDYLAKPFSLAELAARLQAVLARSRKTGAEAEKNLAWNELRMDLGKRQVWCGGKPILLTPTEFRMLEILIRKQGSVATEDELRQEIWGSERPVDSSAVRRYVWLLRQKIEADPAKPARVLAVRGAGYRLGP